MPTLSLTCIETRAIDKAVAAIERTLHCVQVDEIYWVSTKAFPNRYHGIEVTNVLIEDFVDFSNDINKLCLEVLPGIVTTDFNLDDTDRWLRR